MRNELLSLNVKDVLKLQLLYIFAIPFLISIPITVFSMIFGFSSNNPYVYSIRRIITLITIIIIYKNCKFEINKQIEINIGFLKTLIPMLVAVIGLSIILSEVDNFFRAILPVNKELIKYTNDLLDGGISLKGSILAAAVVAPISEEIFFKSFVLKGLVQNYSTKKSIIITAVIFSLMHLDPWQMPGTFIWGLFSGWLYIKTNSLSLCILGHSLNNSLGYIMIYLLGISIPGYTTGLDIVKHQPAWFNILGVFCLAISILLFKITMKNLAKQSDKLGVKG